MKDQKTEPKSTCAEEYEAKRQAAETEEEKKWKAIDEKFKDDPLYDPVKARLYDQAQNAQYRGDNESYCGYMSALGDIGR